MRIAYDHQAFCLQKTGGISRYYCRLAEELFNIGRSESNLDISIFAPINRNQYLNQVQQNIVHGCTVKNYPFKLSSLFVAANYLLAKCLIKRWQPDILHETYYAKKQISKRSCLHVLTVFDMISEVTDSRSYTKVNQYKKSNKYIAVKRADHIICISQHTRKDLINLFDVPENKISVVHLGCDSNVLVSPSRDRTYKSRPYILYVGLRDGYKNFDTLLIAFARSNHLNKNFDLIAFGGGAFSLAEQNRLLELGLDQNQVRHEGGKDQMLNSFYKNATALVYPSKYEGFGLPPLEAMAQMCPVISSNTSSMPEVIGNAAEYFDPYSVDDMTEAIERVVFSTSRTQELIILGEARLKEFSWQRCAQQTLNVYRSLV